MTIQELQNMLLQNKELMIILQAISELGLPDTWLAAGVIRNAVWNYLSGYQIFDSETDVDVVFYEPKITDEMLREIEEQLKQAYPSYNWELKNQAHMHYYSPNTSPYCSSQDAISKYPETCTAIAVRLLDGKLDIFAPYGLDDMLAFDIRPTPHFLEDELRMELYYQRLSKKDWLNKWPQLKVVQG